jgi:hypothetical protein
MLNEDSMLVVECRYCSCYFEIFLRNDDDSVNYCPSCGENLKDGYRSEEETSENDLYDDAEDSWLG